MFKIVTVCLFFAVAVTIALTTFAGLWASASPEQTAERQHFSDIGCYGYFESEKRAGDCGRWYLRHNRDVTAFGTQGNDAEGMASLYHLVYRGCARRGGLVRSHTQSHQRSERARETVPNSGLNRQESVWHGPRNQHVNTTR